jgi:hypothetical protein
MLVCDGPTQARAADGDNELDDLLSAPRLLLSQFIAKWVAAKAEELPEMPQAAAEKLLLDVSGIVMFAFMGHCLMALSCKHVLGVLKAYLHLQTVHACHMCSCRVCG